MEYTCNADIEALRDACGEACQQLVRAVASADVANSGTLPPESRAAAGHALERLDNLLDVENCSLMGAVATPRELCDALSAMVEVYSVSLREVAGLAAATGSDARNGEERCSEGSTGEAAAPEARTAGASGQLSGSSVGGGGSQHPATADAAAAANQGGRSSDDWVQLLVHSSSLLANALYLGYTNRPSGTEGADQSPELPSARRLLSPHFVNPADLDALLSGKYNLTMAAVSALLHSDALPALSRLLSAEAQRGPARALLNPRQLATCLQPLIVLVRGAVQLPNAILPAHHTTRSRTGHSLSHQGRAPEREQALRRAPGGAPSAAAPLTRTNGASPHAPTTPARGSPPRGLGGSSIALPTPKPRQSAPNPRTSAHTTQPRKLRPAVLTALARHGVVEAACRVAVPLAGRGQPQGGRTQLLTEVLDVLKRLLQAADECDGGEGGMRIRPCVFNSILGGPCVQYALAAHSLSQLHAVDGGTTYGLPYDSMLPPVREEGATALYCPMLLLAVYWWLRAYQSRDSPPPLPPLPPRGMFELCLRKAEAAADCWRRRNGLPAAAAGSAAASSSRSVGAASPSDARRSGHAADPTPAARQLEVTNRDGGGSGGGGGRGASGAGSRAARDGAPVPRGAAVAEEVAEAGGVEGTVGMVRAVGTVVGAVGTKVGMVEAVEAAPRVGHNTPNASLNPSLCPPLALGAMKLSKLVVVGAAQEAQQQGVGAPGDCGNTTGGGGSCSNSGGGGSVGRWDTAEARWAWLCDGGPLARRWWRAAVAAVHCGLDQIGANGVRHTSEFASSLLRFDQVLDTSLCEALTEGPVLPPAPPAALSAVLDAGYLPCLERTLRTCFRSCAKTSELLAACGELIAGWMSTSWPLRLAYGHEREATAFLKTAAKVAGRLVRGMQDSWYRDADPLVVKLGAAWSGNILEGLWTIAEAVARAAAAGEGGPGEDGVQSVYPSGPGDGGARYDEGSLRTSTIASGAGGSSSSSSSNGSSIDGTARGGAAPPLTSAASPSGDCPPLAAAAPDRLSPAQRLLRLLSFGLPLWLNVYLELPTHTGCWQDMQLSQLEPMLRALSYGLHLRLLALQRGDARAAERWRKVLSSGAGVQGLLTGCRGVLEREGAVGSGAAGDEEGQEYGKEDDRDVSLGEKLLGKVEYMEGMLGALGLGVRQGECTDQEAKLAEWEEGWEEDWPLLRLLLTPCDAGGILRCCSNPRCAELAGDSEAGVVLRRCGGACGGAAAYCCTACQRAHWAAGHREECTGRRRAGERPGAVGGGG